MQLATILCTLVAVAATLFSAATAQLGPGGTTVSMFSPVYTFNKGIVDATKSCSSTDWTKVKDAMTNALNQLQGSGGSGSGSGGIGGGRKLRSTSTVGHRKLLFGKCENCYGKPLCIFQSGIGCPRRARRRSLEEDEQQESQQERDLQTNTQCDAGITKINTALNNLKAKLEPSCQALLNAPRLVVCTEYTPNCDITGYTVVKNSTGAKFIDVSLTSSTTANSFCSSVGAVNIEAKTTFQMGQVDMHMLGPVQKSSSRATAPYLLWNKGAGIKLSPGTYTLDGMAGAVDMGMNRASATFDVRNC